MPTPAPDFAIIGGGVIGCAIARALVLGGAQRVTVIERATPGAEASNAAAGVLAVASSRGPRGALFDLKRASAARFPVLVDSLRGETGIDVAYASAGLLELAFTSREAEQLDRLAHRRREQGFVVERLDGDAVRARHPEVNPAVRRGVWFADDAALDNGKLMEALHASAAARGVTFRLGVSVERFEMARGRVTAVHAGADRLVPGQVVLAAGAWTAALGRLLRAPIPVYADRGEMLAVRPRAPLGLPIFWREGCLVPRAGGEVLIGSTSAMRAKDKLITAGAAATLLGRAVRMVPTLADASVTRAWSGLRPYSTLGRPIIGPLGGFTNVTVACGHHRNGILLAPITADLVADLLLQRATSLDIQPFRYRRR